MYLTNDIYPRDQIKVRTCFDNAIYSYPDGLIQSIKLLCCGLAFDLLTNDIYPKDQIKVRTCFDNVIYSYPRVLIKLTYSPQLIASSSTLKITNYLQLSRLPYTMRLTFFEMLTNSQFQLQLSRLPYTMRLTFFEMLTNFQYRYVNMNHHYLDNAIVEKNTVIYTKYVNMKDKKMLSTQNYVIFNSKKLLGNSQIIISFYLYLK